MARDLARFLQPATPRERAALADLPGHIGPAEFSVLGAMVVVRCPRDLDPLMKKAGGMWDSGLAAVADRAAADQSAGPQPATRHGPAVPAGGGGPGWGGHVMARQIVDMDKLVEGQDG